MSFDGQVVVEVLPALLRAAPVTLGVAGAAMTLGLAGAVSLLVAETSAGPGLRRALAILQSLVFGMPPLVLILSTYYLLPRAGLDLGAFGSGVAALALFSAFFLKEALRGALAALPRGLPEAAQALGLGEAAIWYKIRLPLVLRGMIPPLVNELTLVVKATALLSAITVTDLMRTAQQIYAANYKPFETLLGLALVYGAINLAIAFLGSRLERRFRLPGMRR